MTAKNDQRVMGQEIILEEGERERSAFFYSADSLKKCADSFKKYTEQNDKRLISPVLLNWIPQRFSPTESKLNIWVHTASFEEALGALVDSVSRLRLVGGASDPQPKEAVRISKIHLCRYELRGKHIKNVLIKALELKWNITEIETKFQKVQEAPSAASGSLLFVRAKTTWKNEIEKKYCSNKDKIKSSLPTIILIPRIHFGKELSCDIICPASCATFLWANLVYAGARAIGIEERRTLSACEYYETTFPDDYPDSTAGMREWDRVAKSKTLEFLKLPKSKQPKPHKSFIHDIHPYEEGTEYKKLILTWGHSQASDIELLDVSRQKQIIYSNICKLVLDDITKSNPLGVQFIRAILVMGDKGMPCRGSLLFSNSTPQFSQKSDTRSQSPTSQRIGVVVHGGFSHRLGRGIAIGIISQQAKIALQITKAKVELHRGPALKQQVLIQAPSWAKAKTAFLLRTVL